MKVLLPFLTVLLLLTGCSQKKYFEPEDTAGDYPQSTKSISDDIVGFNRSGATLEDGQIITEDELIDFKLPKGYAFINYSEKKVIATNNRNKLLINDEKSILDVDGIVVAATLKGEILAMIFSDNTLALYDIKKNKYLLKEYQTQSLANDIRITNPIFMTNIVLFPTLNGKVVVVGLKENKVVKNIVVDASGTFNNIIYLDVVNDTLIAATANKIISVSTDNVNIKEFEIRDVISNKNDLYVATIDGQLIKMDANLDIAAQKKYKFAKIYALAFGTSLYALESQGFIINVDEDFVQDRIYDFSFDEEAKTIGLKNRFYFADKYLEVK